MPKYTVFMDTSISTCLGDMEAANESEAKEALSGHAEISLCRRCCKKYEVSDVKNFTAIRLIAPKEKHST